MASGSAATKNLVSAEAETELKKMILETHANDGSTYDSKLLLGTVERIFNNLLITSRVDATINIGDVGKHNGDFVSMVPIPSWMICKVLNIIYKMIAKAFHCTKQDNKESAMEILKLLSSYPWETKLEIVLASYVLYYAEFSLVTHLCTSNKIAKSIAILKQIPEDFDDVIPVGIKSRCNELVKTSIEVARLIAEISNLPSKYISDDAQPKAVASSEIPTVVYWITTVVVACASILTGIPALSEGTKTGDLLSLLEEKIISKHTFFKTQLDLCNNYIAEKTLCDCNE